METDGGAAAFPEGKAGERFMKNLGP